MKTFKITVQASATQTFTVEADDREEALNRAHAQFLPERHEDLTVFQSTFCISEIRPAIKA